MSGRFFDALGRSIYIVDDSEKIQFVSRNVVTKALEYTGSSNDMNSVVLMETMKTTTANYFAYVDFEKQVKSIHMDRIKADYVTAAQRCVEAGMDGIDLMIHGHYLDSFMTPFWNQRTDEFGGSHENRMRYPLEVIKAIRAAVPEDFIISARMSFDELRENGLSPGELLTVAQDIIDSGVDVDVAVHVDVVLSLRLMLILMFVTFCCCGFLPLLCLLFFFED